MPIEETVRGFKEILEGNYDNLPEQAFYMTGTIADVLRQAGELDTVEEMLNGEEADESAV